jgi:hypothetical protein
MTKNIFIQGFTLGFLFAIILNCLPFSDRSKAIKAINECEKNLPRNQHCILTAIVK